MNTQPSQSVSQSVLLVDKIKLHKIDAVCHACVVPTSMDLFKYLYVVAHPKYILDVLFVLYCLPCGELNFVSNHL